MTRQAKKPKKLRARYHLKIPQVGLNEWRDGSVSSPPPKTLDLPVYGVPGVAVHRLTLLALERNVAVYA